MKTRLSRIHAYPGMIADELAVQIAKEYARPGSFVLDPFCGTGRTLVAAAQCGAVPVGFDVNPLAILIAAAKMASPNLRVLGRMLAASAHHKASSDQEALPFGLSRRVKWFPKRAATDLSDLVCFINEQNLGADDLAIVAAVLSATVRDVCFCRKDQWKLHRMSARERSRFRPNTWKIFTDRLRAVIEELREQVSFQHKGHLLLQDIRLSNLRKETFDLVFTSPPYGDSQTTVQYGGISTLCLEVLNHLENLPIKLFPSEQIDKSCLGGNHIGIPPGPWVKPYWNGPRCGDCFRRVAAFLADLQIACEATINSLKIGGHAIFVVARRTVGGRPLKLDAFLSETMSQLGAPVKKASKRLIKGKLTPFVIHRRGNSTKPSKKDRVQTMKEEFVLVFEKLG